MSIELNAKALLLADQCQGIGESDGWPQLLEAAAAIRLLVAELQARAQVQGEPVAFANADWSEITFPLGKVPDHGGPIYTAPQPAQATQAEVTDAGIEQVLALAHSYADAKLMRYGALGIKEPPDPAAAFIELRRAILALRPERVQMTDERGVSVKVDRELFRFHSKQDWVNKARSRYANCGVQKGHYITVDAAGHVMHMGLCFKHAVYPVTVYQLQTNWPKEKA